MELHTAGLREKKYEEGAVVRQQVVYPWSNWPADEGNATIHPSAEHWLSDILQIRVDLGYTNDGSAMFRVLKTTKQS